LAVLFSSKLAAPPHRKITLGSFLVKNAVIKVRIGRPISVAEQNEYKTIGAYSEFLRKKTYTNP
jgi:hypothetical protein